MNKITPFLWFDNQAEEAMNLYSSIFKNFKIKEQAGVELRGTFLNPFNRHGIGGLVTAINNPFFGQFTGQQRGPRNIELALRVTF